jgi:hypothetical protein
VRKLPNLSEKHGLLKMVTKFQVEKKDKPNVHEWWKTGKSSLDF